MLLLSSSCSAKTERKPTEEEPIMLSKKIGIMTLTALAAFALAGGANATLTIFNTATNPNGTQLIQGANSVTPTFTPLGANGVLQAWRANVTSFVQANITLGATTVWTANEGN